MLELDTRHGWDLLGNPARLRIQTIDALNFGLARRLPVLSGLGADLAVEDDARELYRKAAERLLEHLPGGDDLHSRAVATLLAHVDNRVPRFVDLVIEMLARRDAWGPVLPEVSGDEIANANLRASLERARTELVEAHLAALAREFPHDLLADAVAVTREAAATLVAAGSESPITAWVGHRDNPRGTLADGAQWLGLAALLLTAGGTPRRSFDYQVGFPPGKPGAPLKQRALAVASALAPLEELTARLEAVRRLPEPRYTADEWRVLQAQLVVLRLAAAELEVVFSEQATCRLPAHRGGGTAVAGQRGRAHGYRARARRDAPPRAGRRIPGHVGGPGQPARKAHQRLAAGRRPHIVPGRRPDAVHLPVPECGGRPVPRRARCAASAIACWSRFRWP